MNSREAGSDGRPCITEKQVAAVKRWQAGQVAVQRLMFASYGGLGLYLLFAGLSPNLQLDPLVVCVWIVATGILYRAAEQVCRHGIEKCLRPRPNVRQARRERVLQAQ